MSEKQGRTTCAKSGSSAAGSRVRTSAAQDLVRDSPESDPDSGTSFDESSATCSHGSSSSRTSRVERRAGCARCGPDCMLSGIERAPWGLPREMLVRRTDESGSSLWPTPTVCGEYNRKGLSATSGDGLRTAVLREAEAMWPTPTSSAATRGRAVRGPNAQGGPSLAESIKAASGTLNPDWVEALMGFHPGWTAIDGPLPAAKPSTKASRRER